ncbi:unnamed protein product [Blepharisma stoltei]|uniref:LisH domain-containing protein n=1 Tax=Blepharisma stoltei TaxID=1481888 RepID=A0AAU9K5P5_9CILI|nr:unnamed protein product [Blepharisma stoltei]
MEEGLVQEIIKEYLQFHNMQASLKSFTEEAKPPKQRIKEDDIPSMPKIYALSKGEAAIAAREALKEKQFKLIEKNYNIVIHAGKQLLALAIDATQKLENINIMKEATDVYKEQLTRYNQLFMSDSRIEEKEALEIVGEADLKSLKNKIQSAFKNREFAGLKEQLAKIRTAALAVSPKHRRKIVEVIVKIDPFAGHLVWLLKNTQGSMKINILALVSVMVTIPKGVAATLKQNYQQIIIAFTEILTQEAPGSLGQRFVLGIFQKMSLWNEGVVSHLVEQEAIQWLTKEILERHILQKEYMHPYSLDYGSALLSSLISSHSGLLYLETHQSDASGVMQSLLEMIQAEGVESCVIIHLLISLTSMANDRFAAQQENTGFNDRISEFVENYSVKSSELENEDPENRKIILDMCAHLFHPRDQASSTLNTSEVMEFNAKKHQEEVRELEKKLDDENEILVFECFPDEVVLLV